MPHLLILDDDDLIRDTLSEVARDSGFSVGEAASVSEALEQLTLRPPQLLLADIRVKGGDGLEVCRNASALGSEVVVMTGYSSVDYAVEAMRLGVRDFLRKPICMDRLQSILDRIASTAEHIPAEGFRGRMVGESAGIQEVYRSIARVGPTNTTVMLIGESGTGKELAAEAIHKASKRADKPYIAVNCGAISPNLMESELFGHERGSFTGADRQHKGYFEQADGGTLFLDEVTEMPLELQVKLLRVLESHEFMRVGSHKIQKCDVRVVAATNRNPEQAVRDGRLREDLYYRLAVFPLELPPLRARESDPQLLADRFLADLNEMHGTQRVFSPEVYEQLLTHNWPGNVRELRNYVQRAYVMADGDTLNAPVKRRMQIGKKPASGDCIDVPVDTTLADAERKLILATLERCAGVKKQAATLLGVSPKTLYNRLMAYAAEGYVVMPDPEPEKV
ncbi:sigma-54 dependent transcriptional regulator [Bordetella sp. 15P40C-2]|uniref:sigma-54-dependent transcriptional regulator n=1 Tax=Bordetella sp. 15P40C-2 TaxID=2572246 RepID=UPI00132A9D80|nr:sigma-54 dependent transcriptional regulator [Bordetella sp. 15P40C-2]MVW73208.1 response regulator [Bordetella sp. 15P40C-2]